MKIGINALFIDCYGGGKTFLLELLHSLAKTDRVNSYYVFINKNIMHEIKIWQKNFIFIKGNTNNLLARLIWEQLVLPGLYNKYKLDIFYTTSEIIPLFARKGKMVSTFQNNHFYISPYSNSISWIRKLYFKLFVPTSLSRAERIIAVSYSAKNDLLNYCSALDNKIRVVYEGVSNGFYPKTAVDEDSWQAIKTQYCLKDPFILFVSTLRSFKNADKVIMAYNKIRQEHKTKAQLVIIGNPAEKDYVKYLHSLVQKYDIRSNVVFINHVDRDKLRQFYIFAALLVYPSALETFGLPPLEAMACGCPVIISNRTSLPEVSGAAALIVDPENVVELAEAMLKILRDKELKQELISKGYEQAKKYDWGKSAREVLRVIKEIHEQSQSLH